jgi:hypothetical protein
MLSLTPPESAKVKLSQRGSLEFGAGDSEKVTFAPGATGTFKIDHSLTAPFIGYVSGLSTKNAIDLADLTWSKKLMTATYTGSASGGTLTVSNGTNSVKLNVLGDYRTASWSLSKDKNGGTLVVDPPISGSRTSTDRATVPAETPSPASASGPSLRSAIRRERHRPRNGPLPICLPKCRLSLRRSARGLGTQRQLLPAADMPRCTRWSAVGQLLPPAPQKNRETTPPRPRQ